MDQEFGEIFCTFQTDLDESQRVPSNQISVPTSVTNAELNELVASLLQEAHPDVEYNTNYDFLIAGEILRTTLAEFIVEKNIRSEQTLAIHYIQRLKEPELETQHKVEDWVVRLIRLGEHVLVGQANGSVSVLKSQSASNLHHVQARTYELANVDGQNILVSAYLDHKVKIHTLKLTAKKLTCTPRLTINVRAESIGVNSAKQTLFSTGNADGSLTIFDINSAEPVKSFNLHKQLISCIHYEDETITTGSFDHHIHIFNVNKEKLTQLHCKDSAVYTLSLEHQNLISGHEDGCVRLWDLRENQLHRKLKAAASAISSYLAASFDGTLSIFDMRSDLPLFRITHPDTKLLDALYADDKVYCGGSDKKVSVYSV